VRDGGGHINNYPWWRGVGKTRRRASGGGRIGRRKREREREGGNGAGKRGRSGWKKRRRDGGDGRRGRGGRGGKRSLGSTGVKSRHQTQAALPPSFDPSLPLIQTTLPHSPFPRRAVLSVPPPQASACSSTLTSRACPPTRPIQTSAALPPSVPSSRKGREEG